jgi:hypothetical protein
MNKYAIILALSVIFDLITTYYGFSKGLIEGNPMGMVAVYGSMVMVIILFTALQHKEVVRVMNKYPFTKHIYIISAGVRVFIGFRNILLIGGLR